MATFLRRVVLENYKNIEACDVRLGPLTFLVGPNGSGKSNFLDALAFIGDAVSVNLQHALSTRGGLNRIRRRQAGTSPFGMRLNLELADGTLATYAVELRGDERGSRVEITREVCALDGEVYDRTSTGALDAHLMINSVRVDHPLNDVTIALARLRVYDPQPTWMRRIQPPEPGGILHSDAANTAAVLARMQAAAPSSVERIIRYLSAIVPDVIEVEHTAVADQETMRFRQAGERDEGSWFYAGSMSDGTLRALGLLLALYQRRADGTHVLPLVGIEEPEAMLHPGALAVLLDAMREASEHTQVIATSHSPHLLDRDDIADDQIVSVHAEGGRAVIGHLDPKLRAVLRDKLATPGELLGQGQLRPDPAAAALTADQIDLFDFVGESQG